MLWRAAQANPDRVALGYRQGDRFAARVSVDPDEWTTWSEGHGLTGSVADHTTNPELVGEIAGVVAEANKAVSRAGAIRESRILPEDFTIEGGELTTSLKVRRNLVEAKYGHLIEEICAGVGT